MHILIAEDHPINLKLLRAQLEAEGMTVAEAADGLQALAVLEREPVDVVVSDVLMPAMDGYQLCHALRQSDRFRTVPCILYSNTFASESSQKLALGFGADLFLRKPAPVTAILGALREVMAKDHAPPGRANPVRHLEETRSYSGHLVNELERQKAKLEETRLELLAVNHKLLMRTRQLEEADAGLRLANDELERRVRARTLELEAANADLESFSYSVSHDLRAPLRHIAGFSRSVLKRTAGQLDEASSRNLQQVIVAVDEMGRMISALLSLSRVGRSEFHREPVDLSDLALTVWAELSSGDAGSASEVEIQPGLVTDADRPLVRILLTNLLGNAWKFTRKTPHPRIEFGAGISAGPPAWFVRDNGAGFDLAYAGKLFGAFQRMHSQAEFEGTGIGLATVQRIVRRHGGRIWAESSPGRGATFHFTLGPAAGEPVGP